MLLRSCLIFLVTSRFSISINPLPQICKFLSTLGFMIVFLDIDGTLVTYANEIPISAVEAIHLARENGHQVLVNTGRSKTEISGRIWDIGIDGMIGANGGYVEYQGKVIYHENIPTDTVALLREHVIANEVAFYLECNSGLFSSAPVREQSSRCCTGLLATSRSCENHRRLPSDGRFHGSYPGPG